MKRAAIIIAVALMVVSCSRPIRHGRTSKNQAITTAEIEAQVVMRKPKCSTSLGLLFPGLAQMCTGRTGLGLALAAAGVAELGTMIAVMTNNDEGLSHAGAALPAVAFQDLWAFGYFEPIIKKQLARKELYVPPDSVADMIAAPFNIQVMKRPSVWLGIVGTLAAGIGVSLLVDESSNTDRLGNDPNLFGRTYDSRLGYPLAGAAFTALFSHVAVAEEIIFRGGVQSGLARSGGETKGWLIASAFFGAFHSLNAFALPEKDRVTYLTIGVPFITLIGGYLGWIYKESDYSLAPPIAVHFWYDFLLSATFFALDPVNSVLSAKLKLRF